MRAIFLLRFVAQRLRSRLGLNLLSLVGVVFAVGLATCIPIFAQGVSFRVLREELAELSSGSRRPPFAVRFQYLAAPERPLSLDAAHDMQGLIVREIAQQLRMPIGAVYTQVNSPTLAARPVASDLRFGGRADVEVARVNLSAAEEMGEYIRVLDGAPYGQAEPGERLPVWAHERLCNEVGLNAGDRLDLCYPFGDQVIPAYIAGTWIARDPNHRFWYYDPDSTWRSNLLVTPEGYAQAVQPLFPQQTGYTYWYVIVDERALAPERAAAYVKGLQRITSNIKARLPGADLDFSPLEPLQRYIKRHQALSLFLASFGLPGLGLVLYFFWSLSTVIVSFQREEAAILASRGAGAGLMIGLAAAETALLVAVGAPLGLALGCLLARSMGYTQSFMAFVSRPPIPVSPVGVDWRLLAAAVAALFVARLLPALQAARGGVVAHLRQRSRDLARTGWAKLAVDVPLVVATGYGYWSLSHRGTADIVNMDPLGDPFRDPLLLLAPSLFVFTASLLASHLFPLLVRPLDVLSGALGHFPTHVGLRQLARQGRQYGTALFLIVVCLSLGAFYASAALSLDRWLSDRIGYQVGADLRFRQGSGGGDEEGGEAKPRSQGGWLLPASDYLTIPDITGATRVGRFEVAPNAGGGKRQGQLLAVDRLDLPAVIYFREDLAPLPLGELMNRLGMYQDGLLVSRRFLQANGLAEGQPLSLGTYLGSSPQSIAFHIVGTFDYFPTVYPDEREAFIGNLEYVFEQVGGVQPHEVWLRLDPAADHEAVLEGVRGKGVQPEAVADTLPLTTEDQDRIERVGLFGVLSIGFLAGAVLSCIGLLVFTYASLEGRLQQISVLRAIGVQVRDVLGMVATEYAGVVAYGLLAGTALGIAASHLYVPFFQLTSNAAQAVPPFLPHIAWDMIGWIAAVFAATLAASQGIFLYGVNRRNLSVLLRMGQRE